MVICLIHNFFTLSEALCWPAGVRVSSCALPPGEHPMTRPPPTFSVRKLRLLLPLSSGIACPQSSALLTRRPLGRSASATRHPRMRWGRRNRRCLALVCLLTRHYTRPSLDDH